MKELSKNKFKNLTCVCVVLAICLVAFLAACSNPSGSDSSAQVITVTAADFQSTIDDIKSTPGNYVLNVTEDVEFPGVVLNTPGVTITMKSANVTANKALVGGSGNATITWMPSNEDVCSLFQVNAGKLILEDITIVRSSNYTGDTDLDILSVFDTGTMEITDGVTLRSSESESNFYSCVGIYSGTFIMSGGVIENCSEGICCDHDGTIKITGGVISDCGNEGIWIFGNNNKLTMTGGSVTNCGIGVGLSDTSSNSTLSLTNSTFNNNGNAISINGTHNTVSVKGGKINNNISFDWHDGSGIGISGDGVSVTVSNVEISGNEGNGISIGGDESINCALDISGTTIISGNGTWGIAINGMGTKFTKGIGSIIYGDANHSATADNSKFNGIGAIGISDTSWNGLKSWFNDAGINDKPTATMAPDGNSVVTTPNDTPAGWCTIL